MTMEQISRESSDGERSIRTAMTELIHCGYVERIRGRREDGTLSDVRYVIVSITVNSVTVSAGQNQDAETQCGPDLQERDVSAGQHQNDVSQSGSDLGKHPVSAGHDQIAETQCGPDLGKQLVLAGHNQNDVSQCGSLLKENKREEQQPPTGVVTRVRTRGTRLPVDFSINESMLAWAINAAVEIGGQPPPDSQHFRRWLTERTERFCDYWISESGSRAVKLDWVAAWRNWMRREIERAAATSPGRSVVRHADVVPRMSTAHQRAEAAMEVGRRFAAQGD